VATASRIRRDAGFTLIELLIAAVIMSLVIGSVFTLLVPAQSIFRVQPEVADLQQRLRVGIDAMLRDLMAAGSGLDAGVSPGPLLGRFAPVVPYRLGEAGADPPAGVFYRPDAITVVYVPTTASQTTIHEPLERDAHDLWLETAPNCRPPGPGHVCGLTERSRLLLSDASGSWDTMTVTAVDPPIVHVRYVGSLMVPYRAGSAASAVSMYSYHLKGDSATGAFQLMRYDGAQTDSPVVDNVVRLRFTYFGDPAPPVMVPGEGGPDPAAPLPTYGPAPPPADVDNPDDSWPAGENCTFRLQEGRHVPRLPTLGSGLQPVELAPGVFTDGPWCLDEAHVNRFDADLLRIRRIHVTLRVQVAAASMRGPAGTLFARGGRAAAGYVPDQEITFDVTPRNMSLAR
jgi:prepilin-type N-terminal cleavage/methylation domain-containing protein